MNVGYAIVGFIIGFVLAGMGGSSMVGAFGGLVMGLVFGRLGKLEQRLNHLESDLSSVAARSQQAPVAAPEVEEHPPEEQPPAGLVVDEPLPPAEQTLAETREPLPVAEESPWSRDEAVSSPWMAAEPEPAAGEGYGQVPEPKADLLPSVAERVFETAKNWLTTGNVPVKVGVIISFIGVSFLLKYAVDRQLLVVPIELRLLAVAAAGLALVIVGWRLRDKVRVYALSLQGGGIGILYLTIFAAFRIWTLLPPLLAFTLLVALTVFASALAVLQNARVLAILGIAGGFMAPVLTSTGQGSHVALFSYYLVLNGAILGIAWFRSWRELNLVGFVFTFVIGSVWGYQYYKPALWASTQPFLVLHFLFYNAIAILYALRQPPQRLGVVDGSLVFGTPVIAFALQAALVQGIEYALAISAAISALFYALTATALYRNKDEYLRLLVESFMVLAVAFGTLAIPLAFDARWTSAAWALEGAALVWIGVRQDRELAKLAGVALILFSGLALLDHGWRHHDGLPLLNGNVLGGLLVSLGALFASRLLEGRQHDRWANVQTVIARALFLWGAVFWLGTGIFEISDHTSDQVTWSLWLLFIAASAFLDGWLARRWKWLMARWTSMALLPLMLPLAALFWFDQAHFFTSLGWLAWAVAWFVHIHALWINERDGTPWPVAWHAISLVFLTAMLSGELLWLVDRWMNSDVWAGAAATLVPGIVAIMVWRSRQRPPWPVAAHWHTYLPTSLLLVAVQALAMITLSADLSGDPSPLPYIPVLNPFDIAVLFTLLTAALSMVVWRSAPLPDDHSLWEATRVYRFLLIVVALVLTTQAVVRGVHHYSGVPWRAEALGNSVMVQTALSIYWGLLGFIGMVWGARSQRWPVWVTGAAFMAVVVVKLFLVDLGNTGTVERIVSFIGTGALLLVVGYFAPAPPRRKAVDTEAEEPLAEESLDEES